MKYALLIYLPEDAEKNFTPAQEHAVMEECFAMSKETRKNGHYGGSARLAPTRTAVSVRNQAGKQFVTDGPFAETKEHMVGFYLLDCETLEEATEYARKHPTAKMGATIEVRPVFWQDPAMKLAD